MANLTLVELRIFPLTNSIAYPTSSHLLRYICKVRTIHTCLNITYITYSDYIPYRTWIYLDLERLKLVQSSFVSRRASGSRER